VIEENRDTRPETRRRRFFPPFFATPRALLPLPPKLTAYRPSVRLLALSHAGVCAVIEDAHCVVVVEGVSKAIRRYDKLMTRRVDWASTGLDVADDAAGGSSAAEAKPNACACVWAGTTASPAFEGAFRFETFRSHASARARFEQVGLAHFFDAAAGAEAAADEAAEAEE